MESVFFFSAEQVCNEYHGSLALQLSDLEREAAGVHLKRRLDDQENLSLGEYSRIQPRMKWTPKQHYNPWLSYWEHRTKSLHSLLSFEINRRLEHLLSQQLAAKTP